MRARQIGVDGDPRADRPCKCCLSRVVADERSTLE